MELDEVSSEFREYELDCRKNKLVLDKGVACHAALALLALHEESDDSGQNAHC